ncbi:MAG: hypothetical protein IIB43_00960 [Candidatus Marinimicrobia bacterium]|nr:hypothetical protein [Candidatus Neomarinimicrobiota bacterium]
MSKRRGLSVLIAIMVAVRMIATTAAIRSLCTPAVSGERRLVETAHSRATIEAMPDGLFTFER